MYLRICLHYVCALCVPGLQWGQKSLEQDLGGREPLCGAGNRILVLCKSIKSFCLLSQLSSPCLLSYPPLAGIFCVVSYGLSNLLPYLRIVSFKSRNIFVMSLKSLSLVCDICFLLLAVLLCTVLSLLLFIYYFEKYRDKAKRKREERAGSNIAVHLYEELILWFVLLTLQSKT